MLKLGVLTHSCMVRFTTLLHPGYAHVAPNDDAPVWEQSDGVLHSEYHTTYPCTCTAYPCASQGDVNDGADHWG